MEKLKGFNESLLSQTGAGLTPLSKAAMAKIYGGTVQPIGSLDAPGTDHCQADICDQDLQTGTLSNCQNIGDPKDCRPPAQP
jgi:hypothetical protein